MAAAKKAEIEAAKAAKLAEAEAAKAAKTALDEDLLRLHAYDKTQFALYSDFEDSDDAGINMHILKATLFLQSAKPSEVCRSRKLLIFRFIRPICLQPAEQLHGRDAVPRTSEWIAGKSADTHIGRKAEQGTQ